MISRLIEKREAVPSTATGVAYFLDSVLGLLVSLVLKSDLNSKGKSNGRVAVKIGLKKEVGQIFLLIPIS